MELFTGSHCGACLAADHAFEALGREYDADSCITLAYHVHIPTPDPLANADAEARREYYGVKSAPSTFFNGAALAGSGGPRGFALRKFHQYRFVVEDRLRGRRRAAIDLRATRDGDAIRVEASAQVLGAADPPPGCRLRLALVEESVRHDGGDPPLHHRVVRAMPGGPEGRALERGRGRVEEVVSIDALRRSLAGYLKSDPSRPESRGEFAGAPPPIAPDRLSVVAFVQADDREVLHAVVVPVP